MVHSLGGGTPFKCRINAFYAYFSFVRNYHLQNLNETYDGEMRLGIFPDASSCCIVFRLGCGRPLTRASNVKVRLFRWAYMKDT